MIGAGSQLGPYEVIARIGAGGMGEVWRARDQRLLRDVAIKVLPEATMRREQSLARFELEARAVAALSHPNVLSIHDFGNHEGVMSAVMELLEGSTLRDRLGQGELTLGRALEWAHQIAQGRLDAIGNKFREVLDAQFHGGGYTSLVVFCLPRRRDGQLASGKEFALLAIGGSERRES